MLCKSVEYLWKKELAAIGEKDAPRREHSLRKRGEMRPEQELFLLVRRIGKNKRYGIILNARTDFHEVPRRKQLNAIWQDNGLCLFRDLFFFNLRLLFFYRILDGFTYTSTSLLFFLSRLLNNGRLTFFW